jgi:hypothetical protein
MLPPCAKPARIKTSERVPNERDNRAPSHHRQIRQQGRVARCDHPLSANADGEGAARIHERTLLLYCPEQGGWQTGEWHHEQRCWVSTADIEVVLEPILWTEAPPEPQE